MVQESGVDNMDSASKKLLPLQFSFSYDGAGLTCVSRFLDALTKRDGGSGAGCWSATASRRLDGGTQPRSAEGESLKWGQHPRCLE